jgi:glycosyltransferase involved in cell wall biosynthesis
MVDDRLKVLFIHSGNESFVQLDRELLGRSFDVDDLFMRRKFPFDMVKLWKGVWHADVLYCWFASWNSFWAMLFARLVGKKSVLVIGGYDIADLPEANYGHQRGGIRKWFSRGAMRLADRLITNSRYSQQEAWRNAGIPVERIQVVYHGLPDPFGSMPQLPKERMALTVGKVDFSNLKRKGLMAFVQAAAYLPDVQFILAGSWADASIEHLRRIAAPNVTFTGWVPESELLDYYRKAAVYVQASLHEGFGMSVAEAMLAGCVPVVTRAGALPEVVGDCGVFCETESPQSVARSIKSIFSLPVTFDSAARAQIVSEFPLDDRKTRLEKIIRFDQVTVDA